MRRLRLAALTTPLVLLAAGVAPSLTGSGAAVEPAAAEPPRVLVWGGAYGFRHPSITTGELAMQDLAASTGKFSVTVTENPADLNMATLRNYDALMWVSTTGKAPMTQQQRDDVIRWSACGGGNIGIHAALDSEYGWSEHSQLFGAQFDSHPHGAGAPQARVFVEQPADPTLEGWAKDSSFMMADEYYRWRSARRVPGISLPRNLPDTKVLLSLDETSVASGIQTGAQPYDDDQPIAWKKTFGKGRVFYNNMGHNESTWSVPAFRTSLVQAVDWVTSVGPDQSCLDSDGPLPTTPRPPGPAKKHVGNSCTVPKMRETNATQDFRSVTTKDSQALTGGIPGNLAWGAQTWVVDLSDSLAKRAKVTIDLVWPNPGDDYDLSVTTAWGYYGSDNLAGTPREQVVIKGVPHCAILQVAGDNMIAPSRSGTTATIKVKPKVRQWTATSHPLNMALVRR